MTPDQIAEAADTLYRAERDRRQVAALTLTYPDMTMAEAYAIQESWVARKVAEGRRIRGYKIGLTSRAMQQAVNIDEPDYGVLLDDMFFPNRGRIAAGNFTDPRIETEFAFVMGAPLGGSDVTLEQVMAATDRIVPALELIAARSYRTDPESGYTRTVCDTIADNAANAGVILGEQDLDKTAVDLRWAGALLSLNGEIEETGLAAGVLGHPARGIQWVCRRFAPHGIGLEPGHVVLSGSFTRPVPVAPGDRIEADYGPFGVIRVDFE